MLTNTLYKLLGVSVIALSLFGYIYVLRTENNALEASVESYKLQSQQNALVANQNAQIIKNQELAYKYVLEDMVKLESQISTLKNKQHTKEIEVVKYVSQLPEGFEKQCLNMPVPNVIGRLQEQ